MKNPIIRSIYVYLFSLVGLAMLVIGAAMIINLGLKTWIFTQVDKVDIMNQQPVPLYFMKEVSTVENLQACQDKCLLTASEKEQIKNWLNDYKSWQEQEKNRDPNFYRLQNRQRQAATAISLILVGLPLWLFHWGVIKKDNKEKSE
ncbi:MAG TPA: hypothetical protein PKZ16_01460 [bacterium]|nr:hypothetical protein [bacterium]HPL95221.1 hypothetical protein [bacterium]